MSTFSFNSEIQISECPISFDGLKKKIQELYNFNESQMEKSILSYIDKNDNIQYLFNDEQYEKAFSIIESIIIEIELLDEETYLTFAPLLYGIGNLVNNEKRNIHYGIKCSWCKRDNIEGNRYLCGICKCFNLCQKCEEKIGKDHGHPLLKIRKPELAPKFFEFELNYDDDVN